MAGLGAAISGALGSLGRLGGGASSRAYVTGSGYIQAAREQADAIRNQWVIDLAVETILTTATYKANRTISDMQENTASRNMDMAEYLHDHAKKFWNAEDAFVKEAFDNKKYKANYRGRGNDWGGKMDADLNEGRSDWLRDTQALCLPASTCYDARWQRNAGLRSADIRNYAFRQEENREQALNDQRYSWQYSALGLGQGKMLDLIRFEQAANINGAYATQFLVSGLGVLGAGLQAWADTASPPTRLRPDMVQTYMNAPQPSQTVSPPPRYEPEPLKPCTKRIKVYMDKETGWKWIEVPCDSEVGTPFEARG